MIHTKNTEKQEVVMVKLLMIRQLCSFTYQRGAVLGELGAEVKGNRNDRAERICRD